MKKMFESLIKHKKGLKYVVNIVVAGAGLIYAIVNNDESDVDELKDEVKALKDKVESLDKK